MQLEDISDKDIKNMSSEEIRDHILKLRAARRNYSRTSKKASVKAVKEDNVDFDDLQLLLDELELEE